MIQTFTNCARISRHQWRVEEYFNLYCLFFWRSL